MKWKRMVKTPLPEKKRMVQCPIPECPFKMKMFKKLLKDGEFKSIMLGLADKLGVTAKPKEDFPSLAVGSMDLNKAAGFYSPPPVEPRYETIPWLTWWRMSLFGILRKSSVRVSDIVQGQGGATIATTNNYMQSMLPRQQRGVLKSLSIRAYPAVEDVVPVTDAFHRWPLWKQWMRLPRIVLRVMERGLLRERFNTMDQHRMRIADRNLFLRVAVLDKVYYESPAIGFHSLSVVVPPGSSYSIELWYSGGKEPLSGFADLGDINIDVCAQWDLTRPLR